jgi:tetratricopeptide (TPR) repeat protein
VLKDYEKLTADEPNKHRWPIKRIWALVLLEEICVQRKNLAPTKAIRDEYLAAVNSVANDFEDRPLALSAAAWVLVANPIESARRPNQALELARKAYKQAPDSAEVCRTLGLALMRKGEGTVAVEFLLRARKLYRQRDKITDLILAMAYADSNRSSYGRREYLLACKQIDALREHSEDLDRIRAEADRRFSTRSN